MPKREHFSVPLAQEVKEIKRSFDIYSRLSTIPGISNSTISFLEKSESGKSKTDSMQPTTDSTNALDFFNSLRNSHTLFPVAKFDNKNPPSYSMEYIDPFQELNDNSLYPPCKKNSSTPASQFEKITPLWTHEKTLSLAPVLTLIILSYAMHDDPHCFRLKRIDPTNTCLLSNVRYYLSELAPAVRAIRFFQYYPRRPGYAPGSVLFSVKATTHEYWLQFCASQMLFAMAAENLAARKKAGNSIHTQCPLRWNVYEQAVLFSLLIATPFDILLNWKELAYELPKLDCVAAMALQHTEEGAAATSQNTKEGATAASQDAEEGTTAASQDTEEEATSTSQDTEEGTTAASQDTEEEATSTSQDTEEGTTAASQDTEEEATSTSQDTEEGTTNDSIPLSDEFGAQESFELYVYTALVPLFYKKTKELTAYRKEWRQFSSIVHKECRTEGTTTQFLQEFSAGYKYVYKHRRHLASSLSIKKDSHDLDGNPYFRAVKKFYISSLCTSLYFSPEIGTGSIYLAIFHYSIHPDPKLHASEREYERTIKLIDSMCDEPDELSLSTGRNPSDAKFLTRRELVLLQKVITKPYYGMFDRIYKTLNFDHWTPYPPISEE